MGKTIIKDEKAVKGSAMLATLKINKWTSSKVDRNATKDITDSAKSKTGALKVIKHLIDPAALIPVNQVCNAIRKFHYENTLPWDDAGKRLLPTKNFAKYSKEMSKAKTDFALQVDAFIDEYERHVKDAQTELGVYFNQEDYPSVGSIRETFGLSTELEPIVTFRDEQLDLSYEVKKEIAAEAEKRVTDRYNNAAGDVFKRIAEVVTRVSEDLDAFDPKKKGKDKGIFRDTLVENVKALAAVLPGLNFTGAESIEQLAKDLDEKVGKYTAEELRTDPEKRGEVSGAAKEILSKVDEYV